MRPALALFVVVSLLCACSHVTVPEPRSPQPSWVIAAAKEPPKEAPDLAPPPPGKEIERLAAELEPAEEKGPEFPVVINKHVEKRLRDYRTEGKKRIQRALDRAACYLELTREIFASYGLPEDLAYLAIIESGYRSHAYSRSHAAGPWQFILGTGKRYGLTRDWWVDERRDPVKSADAAARYLKELYEEFEDWYLALAAYNAGEGKVRAAIARYDTKDFWELRKKRYLRWETKNYVPKFLAALLIAKDPEEYGFRPPEAPRCFAWDEVELKGTWDLRVVAKRVDATLKDIRFLNPELRGLLTPPRKEGYTLRLPAGTKEKFLSSAEGGPLAGMVVRHRVERGDSLYTISRLYGARLRDVIAVNNINPRKPIYPRQVILVPVGPRRHRARPKLPAMGPVHLVEMGDSLWSIANRYDTTVHTLCRLNDIHPRERIHPGDRIILPHTNTVHYRVKKGDTLSTIAERFKVALKDLLLWNNLNSEDTLMPGTTLRLHLNPARQGS